MIGRRRARIMAAVCAALVTAGIAAGCGGEVLHPTPADPQGQRLGAASDGGTSCRRYATEDAPKLMLGTHDVWPEGGNIIESYVDLHFDERGCGAPVIGAYDCLAGFPWFDRSDIADNLAFIGVTEMRTAT